MSILKKVVPATFYFIGGAAFLWEAVSSSFDEQEHYSLEIKFFNMFAGLTFFLGGFFYILSALLDIISKETTLFGSAAATYFLLERINHFFDYCVGILYLAGSIALLITSGQSLANKDGTIGISKFFASLFFVIGSFFVTYEAKLTIGEQQAPAKITNPRLILYSIGSLCFFLDALFSDSEHSIDSTIKIMGVMAGLSYSIGGVMNNFFLWKKNVPADEATPLEPTKSALPAYDAL